jgi:membrane protein DedA with SNARE-associated domain
VLVALLIVAATLGDTVNYSVGHFIDPGLDRPDSRWIKQDHPPHAGVLRSLWRVTIIIGRFGRSSAPSRLSSRASRG